MKNLKHVIPCVSVAVALGLWVAWPVPSQGKPPAPRAEDQKDVKKDPTPLMEQWEKEVRQRLANNDQLKTLASKYPLVLLHSRSLYWGDGSYRQAAFSFIYASANEKVHHNDVQILFHNGGSPKTFEINMLGGQDNLVAALGKTDFQKDPDPRKISIDDQGVTRGPVPAIEGHVYLERVRDNRGNNFYVLFQVVAVDKGSRYMAFLWRKLPGGKVVRQDRVQ